MNNNADIGEVEFISDNLKGNLSGQDSLNNSGIISYKYHSDVMEYSVCKIEYRKI